MEWTQFELKSHVKMKQLFFISLLVLLLVLGGTSCKVNDTFFDELTDSLIQINTQRTSIYADGRDIIAIDITISPEFDTLNELRIETNFGYLDSNISTVGTSQSHSLQIRPRNGTKRIYLQADSTYLYTELLLQASMQQITVDKHITIIRSCPDDFVLRTASDSFATTDSLHAWVKLSKVNGLVTNSTKVFFEVQPDTISPGTNGYVEPYSLSIGDSASIFITSFNQGTGYLLLKSYVIRQAGDTVFREKHVRIY